jgi:NAD(P)-dependent dehydrogenase (short-subunit alcohol dehydrogenase family)
VSGDPDLCCEQSVVAKACTALCSIVGFKPFANMVNYSSSKWAVRGMTQGFAMEMAPYGIRVNAYAPGIHATKMWEQIDGSLGKLEGREQGESLKKYSKDLIALGRTGESEDVAKLVSFLASDDSEYITGQNILVDGGIVFT